MNIYQKDFTVKPEIFTLIEEHQNEQAKQYLNLNPSEIHLKGWSDDTPLHIASMSGNFEMVQYLVEKGANVNAERSNIYATPLCWADNYEIARFLLQHGATMNDRELYLATRQNKVSIVDLLLASGAKIYSSEPQYMICSSIDCIQVYLNHGIKINGTDTNGSTLLHHLAWMDRPEVFEFAYQNGCPWQKDSSNRTPYYFAKEGGREKIVTYLKNNYPDLISNKIEVISTANYKYERIFFFKQSLTEENRFFGLTKSRKLIRYQLTGGTLVIEKIAAIDVPTIRNFTFDKSGNIIVPTADSRLLVVEQNTFQLLRTIEFPEDLILDQIEYLPLKNIYLGSIQNWEMILISEDYQVISRTRTENGTIRPKINSSESLIAFNSYNQETHYELYTIDDNLHIEFIHTFFKDWNNTSRGFDFDNNDFAVSFPNEMEFYSFTEGAFEKHWEINISNYNAHYGLNYLVFAEENLIILGKGKILLFIDKQKRAIVREVPLDLASEIRELYLDKVKEHLFIVTDSELKTFPLKTKENEENQSVDPTSESGGFLRSIWKKLNGNNTKK